MRFLRDSEWGSTVVSASLLLMRVLRGVISFTAAYACSKRSYQLHCCLCVFKEELSASLLLMRLLRDSEWGSTVVSDFDWKSTASLLQ